MVFATKVGAVATPVAFVVAVVTPPAKLPDGPLVGAVKVTTAPGYGLPVASVTFTANGTAKLAPTGVNCGDAPVTATMAVGPVVVIRSDQPPVMLPVSPTASSTT